MINERLVTSAHFKHINVHIRILEDKTQGIQRLILSEEQQRTLSLLFFDMVVIN